MKTTIRVFPDYCSHGLWAPDGCNTDPKDLGVSPGLQLALKYWHEVWEFCADYEDSDSEGNPTIVMSKQFADRWTRDGQTLCELLTAESDKYIFTLDL